MAPSAALQAKIAAFENLSSPPKPTGASRAVPSPPQRQKSYSSRNTHELHILDTDPTSPTADSLEFILPLKPSLNPPRSSSPPILGRKSSLIDFSELSASPKPLNNLLLPPNETGSTSSSSSILDTFQKPQLAPRLSSVIPPLPPRRLSQNSLRSSPPSKVITTPPTRSSPISIASSKLIHSESLLNLRDPMHQASNSSKSSGRHLPASSISSFQSVSLSSTGTGTTEDSLDGSYEAVSSTVATSLVGPESPISLPDTLASKKSTVSLEKSNLNNTTLIRSSSSLARRKPPPPPPPKPAALIREAHQPSSKPSIKSSLSRSVPIPINFQRRYNALFDYHASLSQKGHSTSGWRGSSLDLLTGIDIDDLHDLQRSAKLDGCLVKSIWLCSKLPKPQLREIWNECDPNRTGSLDRESFTLGMWRIDEALRVAQQSRVLSDVKKPTPLHSVPLPLPPDRDTNLTYTPRQLHSRQK